MKLSLKQKAAYGLGAVGKDMVYALSASYVMFYYQDTLGLSASIEWKGFDLSVNGSGAFGQQVLNSYRGYANKDEDNFTNNQVARYWTGEGSTNSFPRFTPGSHSNVRCNKFQGDI